MWEIDRDYFYNKDLDAPEMKRVGVKGETINVGIGVLPEIIDLPYGPVVRFRMLDDDLNVMYGGWLHNDGEGLNQQAALAYGMSDSGCTTIEVKEKDSREWKLEIG